MTDDTLPWSHNVEEGSIENAAGYNVAYIVPHANVNTIHRTGQTHSHADADLIVRAVNSHDDLLAAIRNLLREVEHVPGAASAETKAAAVEAIRKATGGGK